MRFYNRTIASYRTNIQSFHSIVQNHFRRNYSKRRAGESAGKVGTEQINSNEHHRQEIIKSICPSKQPQSLQKYSSKIRNTASSKPDHQYTNQTIIHPLIITHPEERIWAGQTPRRKPWVPDAPKIKHDKMKQFYMIDMGRKIWLYRLIKQVRIPLAREGKISLAMKNQTIHRTKIDFAEGWQTRGT